MFIAFSLSYIFIYKECIFVKVLFHDNEIITFISIYVYYSICYLFIQILFLNNSMISTQTKYASLRKID